MSTEFTQRFLESIKDHQLTVIENSEHAKIFRFGKPNTVSQSCTIAYVANTCLITGDMGHYLFGRLLNPYDFFAHEDNALNFDYLKTKVLATDTDHGLDALDPHLAKSKIRRLLCHSRMNCSNDDERRRWDDVIEVFKSSVFETEHDVNEFLDIARYDITGAFVHTKASDFILTKEQFLWCIQAVVYATRLFEQEIKND